MKKVLSILLATLLLLTMLPLGALSVSAATYNFLFPVNNGGKIAYVYGYSAAYGGNHTGIDIHSSGDDTIYAAEAGRVVATANSCPHVSIYPTKCEHYNTFGNYIKIQHSDGTYAYYGHLKQHSLKVSVGSNVTKGQPIAVMGSSGYSSGKHLHFEVRLNNGSTKVNVNPTSNGGSVNYSYSGYGSTTITYTTISTGHYFIKNKADGQYLNVANGKDEDKNTIHTHTFGNWDSQVYNIYNATQGYEMMPLCSKTRVVNPYCWTVESGKTVNLYQRTYENSQWWKFQSVSGGYAIRNVQNPNLCLTTNTSNDALTVETYTGANNQIWILEKACTISYNANGGQGIPASHRTRADYNTAISTQKPTRSGYTFLGWSVNPSATKADIIPGSSIKANNNVTLYAVWQKDASAETTIQITAQPKTGYAKEGGKVSVSVKAIGEGLQYQWYIKNDGASKYSKSSVTSDTYSTIMSDKAKGRRVYCVITDLYGNKVQTKTVLLREAASITKQPATAAYAKNGAKVSVKITASGDGLKYAWYIKNEGSSKYSKSSVTSATYSTTMSSKVKGRRIYCIVTDKYGKTVQSKTFILRESVSITTQPKLSTYAKNGATAKVTVKAAGDGLKYTWYIKNAGSSKYTKSSITKATYSVKMSSKVNGRRLYCIVTDKYGNKVQTQTVILKKK